jgi:transcriptional regulator with XRE-family HTH domain
MTPEYHRLFVGNQIKLLRKQAKMTLSKLGKKVGLTGTSISNVEAGRQAITTFQLVQYADILKTTPQFLLGLKSDGNIQDKNALKSMAKTLLRESLAKMNL